MPWHQIHDRTKVDLKVKGPNWIPNYETRQITPCSSGIKFPLSQKVKSFPKVSEVIHGSFRRMDISPFLCPSSEAAFTVTIMSIMTVVVTYAYVLIDCVDFFFILDPIEILCFAYKNV